MRSWSKKCMLLILCLIGIVYITGYLHRSVDSFMDLSMFGAQFQQVIRQMQQAQQEGQAYDQWVGYAYKNAPANSELMNDFKSRVFQPSCKFRRFWADELPKGMNIPTPATTSAVATTSYKAYMKCISDGKSVCLNQLENARVRFMEPGCQFLSPTDKSSYSNNFTVAFK